LPLGKPVSYGTEDNVRVAKSLRVKAYSLLQPTFLAKANALFPRTPEQIIFVRV
jgi:hypothetical protein